jgi:hypothetical protein
VGLLVMGRPTRVFELSRPSTVNETPSKPHEDDGFVDVDNPDGADDTPAIEPAGRLQEGASDEPDDWGVV